MFWLIVLFVLFWLAFGTVQAALVGIGAVVALIFAITIYLLWSFPRGT